MTYIKRLNTFDQRLGTCRVKKIWTLNVDFFVFDLVNIIKLHFYVFVSSIFTAKHNYGCTLLLCLFSQQF